MIHCARFEATYSNPEWAGGRRSRALSRSEPVGANIFSDCTASRRARSVPEAPTPRAPCPCRLRACGVAHARTRDALRGAAAHRRIYRVSAPPATRRYNRSIVSRYCCGARRMHLCAARDRWSAMSDPVRQPDLTAYPSIRSHIVITSHATATTACNQASANLNVSALRIAARRSARYSRASTGADRAPHHISRDAPPLLKEARGRRG